MTVNELLQNAHFVVDSGGNRTAVVLDYKDWKELMALLEDIEDYQELDHSLDSEEEFIPWEQAQAELRAKGIDI